MPNQVETERRYNDKQLALILKLAAERQAASSRPDDQGLTVAEIQQIAADAGIDPQYVTDAIAALEAQQEPERPSLLGAPTKYLFDRTLRGEASKAELTEMIELISQVTGIQGQTSQVFDSVEWRGKDIGDRHLYVTIRSDKGQTKVKVLGHWWGPALMTYLLAGIGGVAATIGLGAVIGPESAAATAAIVAAGLGASYLTARTIWQRIARKAENRLKELVRRIEETVKPAATSEAKAIAQQVMAAAPVGPQELPGPEEEITQPQPLRSAQRTPEGRG
jgi:hypothetical protein